MISRLLYLFLLQYLLVMAVILLHLRVLPLLLPQLLLLVLLLLQLLLFVVVAAACTAASVVASVAAAVLISGGIYFVGAAAPAGAGQAWGPAGAARSNRGAFSGGTVSSTGSFVAAAYPPGVAPCRSAGAISFVPLFHQFASKRSPTRAAAPQLPLDVQPGA